MAIYRLLLILLLLGSACAAPAQWKYPAQRITAQNVVHLVSPYQLPFLHRPAQNKLDTFVAILLDRNFKHLLLYDVMVAYAAQAKTTEAFSLLYLGCKWHKPDDYSNDFAYLCRMLVQYGAHQALNKYYLNSVVSDKLPKEAFEREVLAQCSKLKVMDTFSY